MTAIAFSLIVAVFFALIAAEIQGGLREVARAIIARAARQLPAPHDVRWREEWLRHLEDRSQRPVTSLLFAVAILHRSGDMRNALLPRRELSRSARVSKRSLDLVFCVSTLFVLAPVLAVASLAIVADSRGPVLVRQLRLGKDGEPFVLLRFRTSPVDPRLSEPTKVGRFLRFTSMDELPRFWNVLRGDMSLVGPRPRSAGNGSAPLPLRPGIAPFELERGEPDEAQQCDRYVEEWSVLGELRIILGTMLNVIRAEFDRPDRHDSRPG